MLCVGSSVDDLALEWDFSQPDGAAPPCFRRLFFPSEEEVAESKSLQMRFVDKADDNKMNALDVKLFII